MSLIIHKTLRLSGELTVPSSKSESIRAIILAALSQGESLLENVLDSADTQDAIHVCRELGAEVTELTNHSLKITSQGLPLHLQHTTIYSGNSGICSHFLMPLLGLRKNRSQAVILECGEQMQQRPVASLVRALNQLGLKIEYLQQPNHLPIKISGQLMGGESEVDGLMSQYLSALLFALPCAQQDSIIKVKNLQERPYVEMTLNYLQAQGIHYTHEQAEDTDIYHIQSKQTYQAFHKIIPGDFSSASYLIAAAVLIPGEVVIKGLKMNEAQGDKKLITILQAMGADIRLESNNLRIKGGKKLSGIIVDMGDIPDLLPTLAVIGTYATGSMEMRNVSVARIKETDRIHSMAEGLTRLGAKVIAKPDSLKVFASQLTGNTVNSYDDHRTVMALSLAGMMAEGKTIITNHTAINKTFPSFVQLMQSLGANMEVNHAATP